jgi:hypothetical protein
MKKIIYTQKPIGFYTKLSLVLLVLATLCSFQVAAQEICDNGIDDDADGFIDCNDTDCSSYIALLNDPACSGDSNGNITINLTGGYPPFQYSWDNTTGNQTAATATGLTAGTYNLTITDSIGCDIMSSFSLVNPSPISIALSTTNETNFGACNGSATLEYSIRWQ